MKAAARFATEAARGDHLLEQRRGAVFGILEVVVEDFHHREHNVEADEVAKASGLIG